MQQSTIGRHFNLDTRDRFLMLRLYYYLYITYALVGFLFDLDQSNICCRDIQKIERLVRPCVHVPQKICNIIKRLETAAEVEKYFRALLLYNCMAEQQIPRSGDNRRRYLYYILYYSLGKKKRNHE